MTENLSPTEREELRLVTAELERRQGARKLWSYYPDTGPLRRELYPKQMEFFAAGLEHHERCAMAGNRVGKTEGIGAYETTLHLTGLYPDWWKGIRFDRPTRVWAAGKTTETTRDIVQGKLFGGLTHTGNRKSFTGTGMIPLGCIGDLTWKPGLPDLCDVALIKHVSGGWSRLGLKTYQQGRGSFEGTEQDLIWFDEEPPRDAYEEALMRTMTTNGYSIVTFTPMDGMSEVVMSFLDMKPPEDGKPVLPGGKFVVNITWDDVPHITKEQKDRMLASILPHQRDARSKGIPILGAGAIYPVAESEITVEPFAIPPHWPRGYAMDVGWNRTAVLWFALDRESDTLYAYSEYYAGQQESVIHAQAVKSRGDWIMGCIDPASRGRSQHDGDQLYTQYINLGLRLIFADNSVEAGIYDVWSRLTTGRLKIFSTCKNFFYEYRLYRRDDKGKVVKKDDHLMDVMRYFCRSGVPIMQPMPGQFGNRSGKTTLHQSEYDPMKDLLAQTSDPR